MRSGVRDRRCPDAVVRNRIAVDKQGRRRGENIARRQDTRGKTHRPQLSSQQRLEGGIADVWQNGGVICIRTRLVLMLVLVIRPIDVQETRGKTKRSEQKKCDIRCAQTEGTGLSPGPPS